MKKGLMERLAILVIAALFATAYGAIVNADDELEWDPAWGYHEEEWYDPSDWFGDDNTIDYEDQYYGGYDPGYYGDTYDYDEYGFDDQSGSSTRSTFDDYGYDDSGYGGPGNYDFGYDYYTNDWFNEESDFDTWWID